MRTLPTTAFSQATRLQSLQKRINALLLHSNPSTWTSLLEMSSCEGGRVDVALSLHKAMHIQSFGATVVALPLNVRVSHWTCQYDSPRMKQSGER